MVRDLKFCFKKKMDCIIYVVKTKVLISFAVTVQLICAFVFAYAKFRFYHDVAHIFFRVCDKFRVHSDTFFFRVCDKFRIHSDTTRAQKLQDLSEKFLESPVFEQKTVGKVDQASRL